jgi:hypothetical protein
MQVSISSSRFTFFPNYEAAANLAATNQADDDSAEYKVEEAKMGFFVAIYEDGERIGTL